MSQTKIRGAGSPAGARVSTAAEDCLEAVLRLEGERGTARVGALAEALGIHKSTVTAALKALAARGLVAYRPYAAARLTPTGRGIARRTSARHGVLRDFLKQVLLLDDACADANACRLEHVLDAAALRQLALLLRFSRTRGAGVAWRRAFAAFAQRQTSPQRGARP